MLKEKYNMNPLFSKKYISQKLQQFNLAQVENFEQRQQRIADWQKMIIQGIVDDTKEESLQADFLNQFFGDVLGYSYNRSTSVWHLEKEYKSQTDSTKADGALGFFTKTRREVLAVIELKDAKTDLDKKPNRQRDRRTPVEQAFDYASKSGGQCRWVIVSNFKEIRLYSYSAGQGKYELFYIPDLFKQDNLQRLFFLMERERLIIDKGQSPVDILYAEREAEQQNISKRFYAEYKQIRLDLFQHLKKEHPQYEDLVLLNKTQKLIDRVIFVLFCEDIGLMPPKVFSRILEMTAQSFDLSITKLWDQLKGLFHSIDNGNLSKNINKFNGGLFETDTILDSLSIQDDVLEPLLRLMEYDFSSDLNVNILGHIFEQSISDLEEIRANLQSKTLNIKQGKRKKDGIFYTPEYITKYIVEQAVGSWLDDQRQALGFDVLPALTEKDYASISLVKRGKLKGQYVSNEKVKQHVKFLEAYREKLRHIKVLDPACGSGAFLNQVFDFIYNEGQSLNADLARLQGGQTSLFDLSKHILTNNLYGVDINQESVEITKLSLWLKTADRNKTLTSLDNNILCGNSLIDDVAVAGDKAFKWEEHFAEIMQSGGFDVVVGNPPYGVVFNEQEKQFLKDFDSSVPDYEIYIYFISVGLFNLLNSAGYLFYIIPNTFLSILYGKKYREALAKHYQIPCITDLSADDIFPYAQVRNCIFSLKKEKSLKKQTQFFHIEPKSKTFLLDKVLNQNMLSDNADNWLNLSFQTSVTDLVKKINANHKLEYFFEVSQGLIPYDKYRGHDKETIEGRLFHADYKKNATYKKELKGGDIARYQLNWNGNLWISYGEWIAAPRKPKFFKEKRVLVREITCHYLFCAYTEIEYYNSPSIINIIQDKQSLDLKYLLAVLNSKMMGWYHNCTSPKAKKGLFPKILINDVRNLPIKKLAKQQQQPFIRKAETMLQKNEELHNLTQKFLNLLMAEFSLTKFSKNLQNWHSLTWQEFDKELKKQKKQKIKLSIAQKSEWLGVFEAEKAKTQTIAATIEQTDRDIDAMVYRLYGLTDEEIDIVEASQ